MNDYDVIVVGAGHAGCEAALAAARMGCRTLLMAIDLDKVAAMPCSPSIGGTAKGQLVKEIDALGGEMARITDATAIQYRTLNTKKGPAVHSTRTQNDKNRYHVAMKAVVEAQPGLQIRQAMVEALIVEKNRICGVRDHTGFEYPAKALVLATGTFLSGLIHIGFTAIQAGRAGEFASYALPEHLRSLGFSTGRMKTGTPPRLKRSSIDFSQFTRHDSDPSPVPFSFFSDEVRLPQLPSFIGHTNPISHRIVRDNLKRSALYGGRIHGVSARYCPSLEDKVVRFSERDQHQVILEPEGLDTDEVYASGLGNSLPMEIQVELVRSVVDPHQQVDGEVEVPVLGDEPGVLDRDAHPGAGQVVLVAPQPALPEAAFVDVADGIEVDVVGHQRRHEAGDGVEAVGGDVDDGGLVDDLAGRVRGGTRRKGQERSEQDAGGPRHRVPP